MSSKNVLKDIDFYCVLDYNNEYKKKRSFKSIQLLELLFDFITVCIH